MLEDGTRQDFKHNVFAFMVDTSEWDIEQKLLDVLRVYGLFGSSLGYEAKQGWLYLTFIIQTAANSEQIVVERLKHVAPHADCYLDDWQFTQKGRIEYQGWVRFSHVLSIHVAVLQEKVGFNAPD
jgi:hypothetical protein